MPRKATHATWESSSHIFFGGTITARPVVCTNPQLDLNRWVYMNSRLICGKKVSRLPLGNCHPERPSAIVIVGGPLTGLLQGYFRSHPLPSERIEQIRRISAEQNWQPKAERELWVQCIFAGLRAQSALAANQYAHAVKLAQLALKSGPNQVDVLQTLAVAQSAQADFEGGRIPIASCWT